MENKNDLITNEGYQLFVKLARELNVDKVTALSVMGLMDTKIDIPETDIGESSHLHIDNSDMIFDIMPLAFKGFEPGVIVIDSISSMQPPGGKKINDNLILTSLDLIGPKKSVRYLPTPKQNYLK